MTGTPIGTPHGTSGEITERVLRNRQRTTGKNFVQATETSKTLVRYPSNQYHRLHFLNFSLVRLFHGTRSKHRVSIDNQGLLPSEIGRLGPGIYLASREIAEAVAKDRNRDEIAYIVQVDVDLGNMKELGEKNDAQGKWRREGFDSCHGIHGPWPGVWPYNFDEWCVADSQRCRITAHWTELPFDDRNAVIKDGWIESYHR